MQTPHRSFTTGPSLPRSPITIDPDNLPTASRHWDRILGGILVALLVFMPAAFGAVEAWSELVVVLAAATLSLGLAARLVFDRDFHFTRTWLYIPLAIFVAVVAAQLIPIPASLARALAPSAVATREELLGKAFSTNQLTTLSFYSLATAEHLRLLLVGFSVFALVSCSFRRTQHIKMLLAAIFVIGCAEAMLSLAQIATGSGSIYWSYPVKQGVHTSGTFINYSNFSQFMNLSLGAGLALLLVRVEEQRRNEIQSGGWGSLARGSWEKNAWIYAGIILCALAVFASMSRNGALSMLVAAAITGALIFQRGAVNWRGWFLAALPLAVFAVLLIFGFNTIYGRLATIRNNESYGLRWEMTAAAYRAWQQYPIWGTGLGTHEFIAPLFESSATPVIAAHADNEYAQLLEETGILGCAAAVLMLFGIATLIARLAIRGHKPISTAVYGIMFGLIAVAVHSATDFGQRLPANLALSATFCGLLVAIARAELPRTSVRRGSNYEPRRLPSWLRTTAGLSAFLAIAAIWTWAVRDAYTAYLGERWWNAAAALESRIQKRADAATDDDYLDVVAAAEGAAKSEPGNVNYGYWLNTYRWDVLNRSVEPGVQLVKAIPESAPLVQQVADDLAAVRHICPTFGPPYALEGQLRLFVLGDASGSELIRKGARLANYDAPTCLVAGELAAREDRMSEAEPLLTRAVELKPDYFDEVVDLYLAGVKRPDLAKALAGKDHRRLYYLSGAMQRVPEFSAQAESVGKFAEDTLRKDVANGNASTEAIAQLARIEQQHGNVENAIELYTRALSQDYQQVAWHLALANGLAERGRLDDAIHEVKVVLRLRPRDGAATKLLEELISRSENLRPGPPH